MTEFPPNPDILDPDGTDAKALMDWINAVKFWASQITVNYVYLDTRAGPVSYVLPDGEVNPLVTIKDKYGHAQANRITVFGDGVTLIDGNPSFQILQNFGANVFSWNGESWSVVG